ATAGTSMRTPWPGSGRAATLRRSAASSRRRNESAREHRAIVPGCSTYSTGDAMRVGIVGWRGMVGSVLMQRMVEEGDFELVEPSCFSTSAAGGKGPSIKGRETGQLLDAGDIA